MTSRLPHLALAFGILLGDSAYAARGGEERLAQGYLEAAVRADAQGMLSFYHPTEITDLRERVLKALDKENTAGGSEVRTQIFGPRTSLDDVRRLTPDNLYLKLAERVGLPSEPVLKIDVIGMVEENPQLMHAVARLTPADTSAARPHLTVISLMRYGKGWRVALPASFQTRVDQLLAPKSAAAPAPQASAVPDAANTPEMKELLQRGADQLRIGDCDAYFSERMSPSFRANTSAYALQRLITDCGRSIDTRETYIAALEIAKRSSPRYEANGTRAVYDMSGQGLPFQRFVLEKVDGRWYVAE